MPAGESQKSLPIERLHVELGARFGEFAGWRMPLWYGGAVEEVRAVRQAAGLFDITHMGRFQVSGKDAALRLSDVFSRDFSGLPIGQSTYALACNEGGGILDDLMVYRPEDSRFLVICNAANKTRIRAVLDTVVAAGSLEDLETETVLFAVQGRDAPGLAGDVFSPALLDMPPRGCVQVERDGGGYFVARTGYTGEDGFEIMAPVEAGEGLFRTLTAAGATPCGLAARDMLRLEASLPLYGLDIDETTTPWEAGLGWALDLEHDFTGSEALKRLKGAEEWRLTCLLGDDPGVMRGHQAVMQGDAQVSETSSGGFSPTLDRGIAMAYLPKELTEPGTQLEVEARGRRIACHVVKRPFYRRPDRLQRPH